MKCKSNGSTWANYRLKLCMELLIYWKTCSCKWDVNETSDWADKLKIMPSSNRWWESWKLIFVSFWAFWIFNCWPPSTTTQPCNTRIKIVTMTLTFTFIFESDMEFSSQLSFLLFIVSKIIFAKLRDEWPSGQCCQLACVVTRDRSQPKSNLFPVESSLE